MVRKTSAENRVTSVFFLDELSTCEHLLPLLPDLLKLGKVEFWVSSVIEVDDDRWIWFDSLAPGRIIKIGALERAIERAVKYVLRRIGRMAPIIAFVICLVWPRANTMRKAERYTVGWADSSVFMLQLAFALGVPTAQIPHGFSVFLGDHITDNWEKDSLLPFHDRNLFDLIIVQTPNLASWAESHGILPEKIGVLGSPRYSREWCETVDRRVLELTSRERELTDVLFLMPNWNYRICWESLRSTVQQLAESSLDVTIGLHVREPSGTDARNFLAYLNSFARKGFDVVTSPAYLLIPFAKIVISAGTSASLQAVSTGRPFLNLGFVSKNSTIYDAIPSANVSTLETFMARLWSLHNRVRVGGKFKADELRILVEVQINQGKSFEEVCDGYMREIRNIKKYSSSQ